MIASFGRDRIDKRSNFSVFELLYVLDTCRAQRGVPFSPSRAGHHTVMRLIASSGGRRKSGRSYSIALGWRMPAVCDSRYIGVSLRVAL